MIVGQNQKEIILIMDHDHGSWGMGHRACAPHCREHGSCMGHGITYGLSACRGHDQGCSNGVRNKVRVMFRARGRVGVMLTARFRVRVMG